MSKMSALRSNKHDGGQHLIVSAQSRVVKIECSSQLDTKMEGVSFDL